MENAVKNFEPSIDHFIQIIGSGIEIFGVLVIVIGIVWSTYRQLRQPVSEQDADIYKIRIGRRLAIMANVDFPATAQEMDEIQAAATKLGLDVATFELRRAEDIAPAFEALGATSSRCSAARLLGRLRRARSKHSVFRASVFCCQARVPVLRFASRRFARDCSNLAMSKGERSRSSGALQMRSSTGFLIWRPTLPHCPSTS